MAVGVRIPRLLLFHFLTTEHTLSEHTTLHLDSETDHHSAILTRHSRFESWSGCFIYLAKVTYRRLATGFATYTMGATQSDHGMRKWPGHARDVIGL